MELIIGHNGVERLTGTGTPGRAEEIGEVGALRLFTAPLSNEIGWLLPLGLASIGLIAISSRVRLPITKEHQAVVFGSGQLITVLVFFSIAEHFHAYYLAMLAPPLAALIGIGMVKLWQLRANHRIVASVLLVAVGSGTLLWQMWIASQYMSTIT